MKQQNSKFYSTKKIYIAYITTIDTDAILPNERLVKNVMALKRTNNKNGKVLLPIDQFFPYYSIDLAVPISMKMKRTSSFISAREIHMIVEQERNLQIKKTKRTVEENVVEQKIDINKKISYEEEVLTIEDKSKVKKLVA